jgi:hypothetical protein
MVFFLAESLDAMECHMVRDMEVGKGWRERESAPAF